MGYELTVKTLATGSMHLNPLIAVENRARSQFHRIWKALDLNYSWTIDNCDSDKSIPKEAGRADVEEA